MKYLQDIISQKGKVLENDILKVDCFLNHQIDTKIMDEIGKEFSNIFKDIKPTKILTVETSGVAIAQATAIHMGYLPVVFAKKQNHLNMDDSCFMCEERSYTEATKRIVKVAKEYLNENDQVLIIDDFLANGEALNSLLNICNQANAKVLGIGVVVAKMYQPGYERIKKMHNNLHILAKIKSLSEDGQIEFED